LINDSYLQWLPIESYSLQDDDLHIWQIEMPKEVGHVRFEKLHALKVKRRKLLMQILSHYLLKPIDEHDFDELSSGKPFLKKHHIQFNTSHTKHLLIIAIHKNSPLGIDIEWIKKRPIEHFSERFWGKDWSTINIKPVLSYLKPLAFFQAWTGTEAWVKALGQTIFNHQAFPIKGFPRQQPFIHENWQFKYFMPETNLLACICCSNHIKRVFLKKITLKDNA
jgi:4'-phosphopantetheinyl transferase